MSIVSKTALVFLTTTALGLTVLTAPTPAQERPCAADAKKFCSDVEPGNRQLMVQCLQEHTSELSEGCKERIQAAKARGQEMYAACADDVQAFCKGVQPGGGAVGQCLKEHQAELSSSCKAALAEAQPRGK